MEGGVNIIGHLQQLLELQHIAGLGALQLGQLGIDVPDLVIQVGGLAAVSVIRHYLVQQFDLQFVAPVLQPGFVHRKLPDLGIQVAVRTAEDFLGLGNRPLDNLPRQGHVLKEVAEHLVHFRHQHVLAEIGVLHLLVGTVVVGALLAVLNGGGVAGAAEAAVNVTGKQELVLAAAVGRAVVAGQHQLDPLEGGLIGERRLFSRQYLAFVSQLADVEGIAQHLAHGGLADRLAVEALHAAQLHLVAKGIQGVVAGGVEAEGFGDQRGGDRMGGDGAPVQGRGRLLVVLVHVAQAGRARPPAGAHLLGHREGSLAAGDLGIEGVGGGQDGVQEVALRRIIDHRLVERFHGGAGLLQLLLDPEVQLGVAGQAVGIDDQDGVDRIGLAVGQHGLQAGPLLA